MNVAVPEEANGHRLDSVLSDVEGIGSRSRAERLISDGDVTVNGKAVNKSYRVRVGDDIQVADAALVDAPVTITRTDAVPILYEDEHLIVVDKPAGLVVHPAPGHRTETLIEMLGRSGMELAPSDDPMLQRPGVVHRLDKETSGVMVLARTREAMRGLQQAIREREVRREYVALVEGRLPSKAGRIEAAIGPDSRDPSKRSIDTKSPKDAVTHFAVEELLPTTTLVRVWLETGRTHQIRVHFQAIGHPVVGDPVYRGTMDFGLERQFLHASLLRFDHPVTGAEIAVSASLPDDLHDALVAARAAG